MKTENMKEINELKVIVTKLYYDKKRDAIIDYVVDGIYVYFSETIYVKQSSYDLLNITIRDEIKLSHNNKVTRDRITSIIKSMIVDFYSKGDVSFAPQMEFVKIHACAGFNLIENTIEPHKESKEE